MTCRRRGLSFLTRLSPHPVSSAGLPCECRGTSAYDEHRRTSHGRCFSTATELHWSILFMSSYMGVALVRQGQTAAGTHDTERQDCKEGLEFRLVEATLE